MQFTKFAVFVAAVFASHPGGLNADPSQSDLGVKTTTTDNKPVVVPTATTTGGKAEITTTTQPVIPVITTAPVPTTTNGDTKDTTILVSTEILVSSLSATVIGGKPTLVPVLVPVNTVVPKVVPILSGATSYSVVGVAAAALVALAL
ncbi:hypothetical protein HDV04_001451 [Boothiomyces sp. JEL0838]|nr:hypothetical protein HDV04_001451 [Boothiomyces sp. JEL0838]